MAVSLDQLSFRVPATVTAVAWDALSAGDAQKLRNLGLDDGVRVEMLHSAPFGRDPVAIRVGRMTIAMRRANAAAILVEPGIVEAGA